MRTLQSFSTLIQSSLSTFLSLSNFVFHCLSLYLSLSVSLYVSLSVSLLFSSLLFPSHFISLTSLLFLLFSIPLNFFFISLFILPFLLYFILFYFSMLATSNPSLPVIFVKHTSHYLFPILSAHYCCYWRTYTRLQTDVRGRFFRV